MLTATLEEHIFWVHSEGVNEFVPMPDCKDAGKKLLELIWTPLTKQFDRDCVTGNTRRRSKATFKELSLLLSCSRQCHLFEAVKVLVSIMMSVGWSHKGKPLKLRYHDFQRKIDRNMVRTKLAD